MLLNPDDSQDGNTSQDSGHHDHTHDRTDVNTSHNLDDNNGDRKAIDDYYGNIDESSYNIDQGDRYGYNDYSQYLVQPDNNYQSTDCYSDPQPEGIDYQKSSCDYDGDGDCDYSDYGRGNDNYSYD